MPWDFTILLQMKFWRNTPGLLQIGRKVLKIFETLVCEGDLVVFYWEEKREKLRYKLISLVVLSTLYPYIVKSVLVLSFCAVTRFENWRVRLRGGGEEYFPATACYVKVALHISLHHYPWCCPTSRLRLGKFNYLMPYSYQVYIWIGQDSLKWSKEYKKYNRMYKVGCVCKTAERYPEWGRQNLVNQALGGKTKELY